MYLSKRDVRLLLYVDDIVVIGPSTKFNDVVKQSLHDSLDMKDLGDLHEILGVKFVPRNRFARMSQSHYDGKVLERFGLTNWNPVTTPMCTNPFPRQNSADLRADRNMYQEMIGSLLFISTRTRPDISAAVGILCRYSSSPKQRHFIAVRRVSRYLKGTKSHVLLVVRPMSLELVGYADAN